MRTSFINTLIELAEQDPRIVLLTGDMGFNVLEPFARKLRDRFFNVGVAEQNMIGLATGMAEAGFIPFVYSIVPFAVLRPYEFIRNGPVAHNLPVRIIGIGGGFEYSHNGLTHYGLEDIGVLRLQPGLTIIAPADHKQAQNALRSTWDIPRPIYYRISKNEEIGALPGLNGNFKLGRGDLINKGKDLLFITMGSIAGNVVKAAQKLKVKGISASVMVISSMNPAPLDDLKNIMSGFRLAITVENHYSVGGLGSLVSEIVAANGINCVIMPCGINSMPNGTSGSEEYLHHRHGISEDLLIKVAVEKLGEKHER